MLSWKEKVKEYVNNETIFNNLVTYVNLIIEKNKQINLTGFDEKQIWLDGIYQSIVLLDKSIGNISDVNLLDIGAGVGFPSIPYLIYKNNNTINLTIYEPIKKRVDFLYEVINVLNLKNVYVVNKRIEDEKQIVEHFDLITARAVMPLRMLIEVSNLCGKINSKYIFLKSKNIENEIEESKWIIDKLKISSLEVNHINLDDEKIHNVVCYYKRVKTPHNFPRKWSEIKKDNK